MHLSDGRAAVFPTAPPRRSGDARELRALREPPDVLGALASRRASSGLTARPSARAPGPQPPLGALEDPSLARAGVVASQ